MKALNVPDVEPVLKKLATMFDKNYADWIDVDFSQWGSSSDEREKFNWYLWRSFRTETCQENHKKET